MPVINTLFTAVTMLVLRRRSGRHARTGGARTETARAVLVTDARTGGAHLVTDEAAVAGRRVGRYVAACGAEVLAASLTTPERHYCVRCTRWLAAVSAFQ